MNYYLATTALFLTGMLSTSVFGSQSPSYCEKQITQNITVTPAYIMVQDEQESIYSIDPAGQITIAGKALLLNQQKLVLSQEFSMKLRDTVTKQIALVTATTELAADTVSLTIGEIFGKDSDIYEQVQNIIAEATSSISVAFYRQGDIYKIGSNGYQVIDEAFGEYFETSIEEAIKDSMGFFTIIKLLATQIFIQEGGFAENMEAFGERMEAMGERLDNKIESTIENKTDGIKKQSEDVCEQLKFLDGLETQLQMSIKELPENQLIGLSGAPMIER
jgi:phage-related protein